MAEKKSILQEALLDIKTIQNALNANTKEILRSVAKDEINGVVKESLMDEVYEEEELEPTDDLDVDAAGDELSNAGSGEELDLDSTDELGGEELGLDSLGSSDEPVAEPEMDSELGMDTDVLGGDELDMTAASDDEVIAIYKRMTGDDEIEIVGDEIHMNITEPGEYVVKMDGANAPAGDMGVEDDLDLGGEDDLDLDGEDDLGGEEDSDDVEYEIELDDEESDESEEDEAEPDFGGAEDSEEEEEEVEELDERITVGNKRDLAAKSNIGQPMGAGAKEEVLRESAKHKKIISETTNKYNTLLTEAINLKNENEEFRKALKVFRNKLVETVIFNSNLSLATRLFLEHSTTKAEKDSILKRFDQVTTIKESKKLYKIIGGELESRKPITESIENKIIKEASTSVSKQLNESTAYVDPSTKRIMDLINRVEKR